MKTVDLDSPIRLGRTFWIIYALVGLPALPVIRPWTWDEPLLSRTAGFLFLPFATAIAIYCVVLVVSAIFLGGAIQRRKFLAFLIAIGIVSIGMTVEWALSGFKDSRWATPALASFFAMILYGALSRKCPNQLPDPTSPPVTPPAVAGGAPSVAADH